LDGSGPLHADRAIEALSDLPKLSPDPSGRYSHNNALNGADFLVGDTKLPGHAEQILHSRVTAD
jgi:hypothetical protein